jgi:PIN domain nuclease of toxin-antitoxin system
VGSVVTEPGNHQGFLLDTHALFFLDTDPDGLVPNALLAALAVPGERVFVSSLSAWEMSIKHAAGRWPEVGELLDDYNATLVRYAFLELPLQSQAALLAGKLPPCHKDPFDRGLIAQAVTHGLTLVSQDPLIHAYVPEVPNFTVRWD